MNIVHLDPWHKMSLGWCEPRIRSIHAGGVETIPATQMLQADAPLILYDPVRGINEYFILEYRTRTSPNGSGYDSNVPGNGLVVWHIKQDANHNLVLLPDGSAIDWSEGAPSFQHPNVSNPSAGVWTNTTPSGYLIWLDGTQTLTRFRVRPFTIGDGSITIELLAAEDTWIDFNYGGIFELGTFSFPFNTLAEGVADVSYGGILNFKTGSSPERMTINKPMTLKGYNGPVTIGR